MLSINGKKFMNLPEAVQWLLNNNALPFQCKANYVADTVIAKSDIINPSPAEIKVGSLILFADSKVGTVSGVTDSGFMVGQDYTNIGSQLNQIIDIELDASQHLVFTMANGDTIDAGLVKELSGLSIDASQHLIATYNDGSTTDLGAIFSGDVNISGILTTTHAKIFKDIEDASGKNRFIEGDIELEAIPGFTKNYAKWSLSGTHFMIVIAIGIDNGTVSSENTIVSTVSIPAWIGQKIFTLGGAYIDRKTFASVSSDWTTQDMVVSLTKVSDYALNVVTRSNVTFTKSREVRIQFDLLIDSD